MHAGGGTNDRWEKSNVLIVDVLLLIGSNLSLHSNTQRRIQILRVRQAPVGTREEPGTLTQGAPVFPGSSRLGNRTQNSRVTGARPNHQADRGSDPNHRGIWSPPMAMMMIGFY